MYIVILAINIPKLIACAGPGVIRSIVPKQDNNTEVDVEVSGTYQDLYELGVKMGQPESQPQYQ